MWHGKWCRMRHVSETGNATAHTIQNSFRVKTSKCQIEQHSCILNMLQLAFAYILHSEVKLLLLCQLEINTDIHLKNAPSQLKHTCHVRLTFVFTVIFCHFCIQKNWVAKCFPSEIRVACFFSFHHLKKYFLANTCKGNSCTPVYSKYANVILI